MKRTVLIPQYMREFSCIGSACEDTCCSGWQITVDENTYKKYEGTEDLKESFLPYLKKFDTGATREHYAEIILRDSDASCPHLTESKLCGIHKSMGEKFLSNLCVTYPRVSNIINGNYEKSGTVSCPEVARLALLNPNGIIFEEVEESVKERHIIVNQIDTKNLNSSHKVMPYLLDLRKFTIKLLQNRNYSLSDRLIILGMLFANIKDHIKTNRVEEIPNQLIQYNHLIESGLIYERLIGFPINIRKQLEIGRSLINMRLFSGVKDKRYLQCLMESLEGIRYTNIDLKDDSIDLYKTAYQNYYQPFMEKYEYILENFLVNYVFKNVFPIKRNVYDDYILLITHYTIVKMHLIGMMGYHREAFNTDHVIKLIQSFSRVVEHAPSELTRFRKYLKENNYSSLPFMAILIKN